MSELEEKKKTPRFFPRIRRHQVGCQIDTCLTTYCPCLDSSFSGPMVTHYFRQQCT